MLKQVMQVQTLVIACDERNATLMVAQPNKVYVYPRTSDVTTPNTHKLLTLQQACIQVMVNLVQDLHLPRDSKWLVVGAPKASNLKLNLVETLQEPVMLKVTL